MNILLVSTQDYIHHPIPSRHHHIFELLADRHEIHVAHFHVSRGHARFTKLRVHETTLFPFKNPMLHYSLNAPYQYQVFRRILEEHKIDVIVGSNVLAGTAVIHAARPFNTPIVFDLKDWFPDSAAAYYRNQVLRALLKDAVLKITKYNLSNSDLITTVSPALVQKLAGMGYKASLITNGVNTAIFKPLGEPRVKTAKASFGFHSNDFVIGFSGSVERWYALDDVMRAFSLLVRRHENLRLLIVGSSLFTDYASRLRTLANSLNIKQRVVFTGAVAYEKLPLYINTMDVCLIPLAPPDWASIAMPDKFFEYSACGKPILCSPIPSIMNLGTPNLFPYHSYEEFVDRIERLIKTRPTFRIRTSVYDWKQKALQFERLLKDLDG
jgi:phosphatidylinositol alpha-1,6-mannosyltransferase